MFDEYSMLIALWIALIKNQYDRHAHRNVMMNMLFTSNESWWTLSYITFIGTQTYAPMPYLKTGMHISEFIYPFAQL